MSPRISGKRGRKQPGRRSGARATDPAREAVYKQLSATLEQAGVSVRREELKRGHGWKVVSGACRVFDKPTVFVDRQLSQDDQISFLRAKLQELNIECAPAPSESATPKPIE